MIVKSTAAKLTRDIHLIQHDLSSLIMSTYMCFLMNSSAIDVSSHAQFTPVWFVNEPYKDTF